ncbi:hypothetical protein PIROE2DRAFT_10126 [Piromyces sp. E2]|nr:hypothetical protein PIROE2DRAFT_10126 [Piromyces sp. E2]|eukprot:OUM63342.1 hypothetical protein PIROE2DRAFT_10126 [Piromyces sp. E2]
MEKDLKIPVQIVNGNAFIWDPEDVITLRTKYRIVGSLVGLLPKSPLQNIFSSLPLHLLPEEVSLLLEKAHHKPNSSEIKLYNDEQEKIKEKDNQEFQKQKNEHIQRNLNKKNNKKIIKNTSNSENDGNNNTLNTENKNGVDISKSGGNHENVNIDNTNKISNNDSSNTSDKINNNIDNNKIENNIIDNNNTIENTATLSNTNISTKNNENENNSNSNGNNNNNSNNSVEPKKKKKEKEKSQLVHIQTNSKNLPWYHPSENNYENECYTLEEAKSKNIWNYPNTPNELQKYKIFCDIWEKPEKYYITSGSKYGSDYLIYPGNNNNK